MRRWLFVVPVAVFAILAAYFALSLRPGRDPQTLPSAMIDKPVPAIDLAALDGGPHLTNAALAGHAAMVNFFASWCVPCRAEHPILLRIAKESGVPLIGIAYEDKPEDTKKFIDQLGDPFTKIGLDRDGRLGIDFGVYGVPETYLIDKAGYIRYRHVAPIDPDSMDLEILPRLKKLAGP